MQEACNKAGSNNMSRHELAPKITMLTQTEYERRKPLWTALSELWLDTELDHTVVEHIARVAAQSDYSLATLNEIYLYEVAPVVYTNLLVPAGIWESFNKEWLHTSAKKNADRRSLLIRFLVWSRVGRKLMTYACEKKWMEILKLVEIYRESSQV
jgi:hypothetical protein